MATSPDSFSTSELEAFVEEKRQEYGDVEFISAGSSLKFCLVAEGKADIYPRLGPTIIDVNFSPSPKVFLLRINDLQIMECWDKIINYDALKRTQGVLI